jgi:hypothetical protein
MHIPFDYYDSTYDNNQKVYMFIDIDIYIYYTFFHGLLLLGIPITIASRSTDSKSVALLCLNTLI